MIFKDRQGKSTVMSFKIKVQCPQHLTWNMKNQHMMSENEMQKKSNVNKFIWMGETNMIKDTMEKIEQKIKNSEHITSENKKEYLKMLATLRNEVSELSKTKKEHAETITGFACISTHEAMRTDSRKDLLNISLDGLKTSVEGFEASNPGLVSIVNSFCSLLSNIGI